MLQREGGRCKPLRSRIEGRPGAAILKSSGMDGRSRYRAAECRALHGTQVVPRKFLRPGISRGAFVFGGESMKELPKIYDPKQVEKKISLK